MMPQKRRFGQLLRKEIKEQHHLFDRDIVSSQDCRQFVDEIEEIWHRLGVLTENFRLEILEGKKICFIRSISKEERKEYELARIPLETGREGKGTDLLQLTWLLIIESWDQLFARRLEKEKGDLFLDRLISFQEKEYAKMIEKLEGENNGGE